MSIFFTFQINDALDLLGQQEDGTGNPLLSATKVQSWEDLGGINPEHSLGIALDPDRILNLLGKDAAAALCRLLDQQPLMLIMMQLSMDRFLVDADANSDIQAVIDDIYSDDQLPDRDKDANPEDGRLYHPMLEHMTGDRLVHLYLSILQSCIQKGLNPDDLGLGLYTMLKPHPDLFLEDYDGYRIQNQGYIRLMPTLTSAIRIDEADAAQADESCIDQGREGASALAFEEDSDLMTAWLHADRFQARLCHDIHRLLGLLPRKHRPEWIRKDMFRILGREAMKQIFAQRLIASDIWDKRPADWKKLDHHITTSAKGDVNPALQQAANEILNQSQPYTGTLQKFAAEAESRAKIL